ncbi:Carboxylesterase [bioreactor metagenome]|uniref:Carboxylesterase n=1 Tax=bioreactor metagenome TaxID=1076179 RepID=A0A644TM30_9ZZZZ|nr:alpha/beta fold hydrolase [Negativicutes bacterium]
MAIMEGAEPFLLPGGEHGVIVIHGFTGSPSEMRLLGNDLNDRGYTVLAPRLTGHGATPEAMASTTWHEWYSDVEDAYHIMSGICKTIDVVGLSMGGLLALKLAAEYPVSRVVSLSAPIFIADRRLPMLSLYRLFREFTPKRRRKFYDVDPLYSVCYDRTPLKCVASLLELIQRVDKLLLTVCQPALVVQSRNDHTVRPKSGQHIYEKLGSNEKQLIWLEESGHIITLDSERAHVFEIVADFIRR